MLVRYGMHLHTRRNKFMLIALAAIPFVLSSILVINTAIQNDREPLNWLRDQVIDGVCEAADSLRASDASRVIDAQGVITPEHASARAAQVFAAQVPGQTALAFSRPVLTQARVANGARALTYLVFVSFRDAPAPNTSDDYGATAILYLDAVTGNALSVVMALNVVDPASSCLN